MRLIKMIMAVVFTSISLLSTAQTAKPAVTDEDLRKYAVTQDSVKGMQQTLTQIISENVQTNTVMTVARYNELFKLGDDQAKLTAVKATPEEIAFIKEIADLRQYNIERINTAYQALAKDYVGLKAFNTIRKSLDSDPNLKSRYEAIAQELASEGESASTKGN